MQFVHRHRYLLEAIAIVVIAAIIGVLIAFYGSILGPRETSTPVAINEVYPAFCQRDPQDATGKKWVCLTNEPSPLPHQWIELYNRTNSWQTLDGWTVEMSVGQRLPLPRLSLPPQGFAIVAASVEQFMDDHPGYSGLVVSLSGQEWPGLDRQNAFVVLRNAQGQPTDVVNWGHVDKAPADVKLWEQPAFTPGVGWLFDSKTKAMAYDHSLERRPLGMDRDIPADFLRQPFPSPGTVNQPSATKADQLLFIDWTNVVSFAGGIVLWVAFIFVALIARRFEALTQQRTFWQVMLIAPSGILFYNIVQAYGFLTRGAMSDPEKWWGFVTLFISALLCTFLVFIFRQRAKKILEG